MYKTTGLTCSVGVAPNRLLAKVCSDINKPNGQFVLPNDWVAIMTFISSLPIRKVVQNDLYTLYPNFTFLSYQNSSFRFGELEK